MKFNFNISRIRFRVGSGQRGESWVAGICITRGNGALNGEWRCVFLKNLLVESRASPPGGAGEMAVAPLDHAQEFARLLPFWEALFFRQKFARVHASPAPSQPDWVLQVQHLVKQNVFDRIARHARAVEDAADDDGVVGRIVVAEATASVVTAPGKLRASQESMEEAAV